MLLGPVYIVYFEGSFVSYAAYIICFRSAMSRRLFIRLNRRFVGI